VFPHEYRRAMAESEAVKAAEEAQKELLASSGGSMGVAEGREGVLRAAQAGAVNGRRLGA
jgi:hypothetical protein